MTEKFETNPLPEEETRLDPRAVLRGVVNSLPEEFPHHLLNIVQALYAHCDTRWQKAEQLEQGNVKFGGQCSYSQLAKYTRKKWRTVVYQCEALRELGCLTWHRTKYGISFLFTVGEGFRQTMEMARVEDVLYSNRPMTIYSGNRAKGIPEAAGKLHWLGGWKCPDCKWEGNIITVPCVDCYEDATEPSEGPLSCIPPEWVEPPRALGAEERRIIRMHREVKRLIREGVKDIDWQKLELAQKMSGGS